MLERLVKAGTAIAGEAARRRRRALAAELREEAPAGVRVEEEEAGVAVSGPGLGRRVALEASLRWLAAGRRR
jgi:hypothetical protein